MVLHANSLMVFLCSSNTTPDMRTSRASQHLLFFFPDALMSLLHSQTLQRTTNQVALAPLDIMVHHRPSLLHFVTVRSSVLRYLNKLMQRGVRSHQHQTSHSHTNTKGGRHWEGAYSQTGLSTSSPQSQQTPEAKRWVGCTTWLNKLHTVYKSCLVGCN